MNAVAGWKFFRGGSKNGRILQSEDDEYFETGVTILTSAGRLPVYMARNDIRPIVTPCSARPSPSGSDDAYVEFAS